MNTLFVLVIVVLSVLLVCVVLVQKSKGGGLAAGFQSANSTLGAPKTANFLEKATWYLMGIIAVLCILCTVNTHKGAKNVVTPVAAGAPTQFNENVATDAAPALEVPAADEAQN